MTESGEQHVWVGKRVYEVELDEASAGEVRAVFHTRKNLPLCVVEFDDGSLLIMDPNETRAALMETV